MSPIPQAAKKSPLGDAVALVKERVSRAWATFRRQTPLVQYSAAGILLVLVLLLRSLVAPILLVATVALSFLATLGVCALAGAAVYVIGLAI